MMVVMRALDVTGVRAEVLVTSLRLGVNRELYTMQTRTTYLTATDPSGSYEEHENGVTIKGLVAAKHVHYIIDSEDIDSGLGVVSVEFSRSQTEALSLPFDPPSTLGLHVYSELDSEPEAVLKFVDALRIPLSTRKPISTSDWYEWNEYVDSIDPQILSEYEPLLKEAVALRITYSPSNKKLSLDAWYSEREWSGEETAPTELGILSRKQGVTESFILHGQVWKLNSSRESKPILIRQFPKHQVYGAKPAPISIGEPYGFHPELLLHIDGESPLPQCRLFAKLDLPKDVFVDQYQLDDLPRMSPRSQLIALWGEKDLEKPAWQVDVPSTSLIRLYETHNVTYKIPMHTRYQLPNESLQKNGEIPAPYLFWACKNDDAGHEEEFALPYESVGIDSVFPYKDTSFYVWETNSVRYEIPVISENGYDNTVNVTATAVVLSTLMILGVIIYTALKRNTKKLKAE